MTNQGAGRITTHVWNRYCSVLLASMISVLACGEEKPETPIQAISQTLLPALAEEDVVTFCDAQLQLVEDAVGLEQLIAVNCLLAVPQLQTDSECVQFVDECVVAGGDGNLNATREAAFNHIRTFAGRLGTLCFDAQEPDLCEVSDAACPIDLASFDCNITVGEVRACLSDSALLVQEQFVAFECSEPRTDSSRFYLQGNGSDGYFNAPESCGLLAERCSLFE